MKTAQIGRLGAIMYNSNDPGVRVEKWKECVLVPVVPSSGLRPESRKAYDNREGEKEKKKALKRIGLCYM